MLNTIESIENRLVPSSKCRIWIGTCSKKGYGQVKYQKRTWRVHILIWVAYKGRIPRGMKVCHTCDNPPCARLSHLFLGTQKRNMEDAVRKGRMATGLRNGRYTHPERTARGSRSGKAKTNEKQVFQMRAMKTKLSLTNREIAELFPISYITVGKIVSGQRWQHLL